LDQSLIDEVLSARAATLDTARPEAVAKVRARGHLTALNIRLAVIAFDRKAPLFRDRMGVAADGW
jgi:hypothetical protein